jgi:hypothetical protein
MKFHEHNRECHAEPFASLRVNSAKHLVAPGETLRFAQGDIALPILLVKIHNRLSTGSRALQVVIERWRVHHHLAYPDIAPAQKGVIPFAQPVAHSIYENLRLVKGCVGDFLARGSPQCSPGSIHAKK